MTVTLKRSPFKNGILANNTFAIVDGIIFKLKDNEINKCIKESGENWTAKDCDSIINSLMYRGFSIRDISGLTGYTESYTKQVFSGQFDLTENFRNKLIKIEEKVK